MDLDLPRTLPELKFFCREGVFHEELRQLLRVFAELRPDMGYVQGMSYIAAMVQLYSPDAETAFVLYANILNLPPLFHFYTFNANKVDLYLEAYSMLLADAHPLWHEQFERLNIIPKSYVYNWLLTLYARYLPLDVASRVWDVFFLEGVVSLLRTAVGVVRVLGPRVQSQDADVTYEAWMHALRLFPPEITEAELFDAIFSVSVPQTVEDLLSGLATF